MSALYDDYNKVREQRYESQLKFWELVSSLNISEENKVALEKALEVHQNISIQLGIIATKLVHHDDD